MNPFDELLKEFASFLKIELHSDQNEACCLQIDEKLKVQISPDKKGCLVIFSLLEELCPGKFREEVLKEGLKANAMLVSERILGFSGKTGHLALHQFLNVDSLTGAQLFDAFLGFIEYATKWQTALYEGKTSPFSSLSKTTMPSPMAIRP